jgi:hypothetical protein
VAGVNDGKDSNNHLQYALSGRPKFVHSILGVLMSLTRQLNHIIDEGHQTFRRPILSQEATQRNSVLRKTHAVLTGLDTHIDGVKVDGNMMSNLNNDFHDYWVVRPAYSISVIGAKLETEVANTDFA